MNFFEVKVYLNDLNVKVEKDYYDLEDLMRYLGEMIYMENRLFIIMVMD